MSASELFDLIRPVVTVFSALVSAWVLASARNRFPFYQALLWAAPTFFFPLIVVPIYLVVLLVSQPPRSQLRIKGKFILPLFYLVTVLTVLVIYKYFDDQSIDAHLSRASLAKVSLDPLSAIREYHEALRIEDSPHTHKLLAETLDDAGFNTEAITEFRAAEQGGDPDDAIHFRLGVLLGRVDMEGQSILEFKKFALSETCLQIDSRCEDARHRIEMAEQTSTTKP